MRRLTLRMQLTLLYAVPFLVTGAALLAIPSLALSQTEPAGAPPGTGDPHATTVHRQLLAASAIGLAIMVVIAVVLGWLIAGRFLRPLRTITAAARDISARNLHRRLGLPGRDEFAQLADTLDDLFARLEASFASQRHFVANASHELRTPLTAERTLLQVALADPDATTAALRSTCQQLLILGQRQERLIEALLTLASSERGIERRQPLDLADVAGRVVADRPQPDIRVETALAPAPTAGDPNLLESLVTNLVDNALRHNVPGGRVHVGTTVDAGRASLTVTNTGPTIPADQLDRLFQPFQRLGEARLHHTDGHGLGLAIVQAITTAHHAALTAYPNPAGGLTITVTFP
jgi:signal transduction histidine kinase